MREVRVRLEPVVSEEYPQFRRDIQEAFSVAVVEEFGDQGGEPIPSDAELNAAFAAPGALVFHVMCGSAGWWWRFILRRSGIVWCSFLFLRRFTAAGSGWRRGGRWSGCFRIQWCGRR